MQKTEPIEYSKYYHIYNRGINGTELFRSKENYLYFLRLYDKYIESIADTYAWCLMKNHFHLLVRIKEDNEIGFLAPLGSSCSKNRWQVLNQEDSSDFAKSGKNLKKPIPVKQFSHLFNAYTKAFNKRYNRTGSLFEKNFRRISVTTESYLRYLVYYIHHNPVHHGFTDNIIEYPWSSYLTMIKLSKTKLKREEVLGWYDDVGNFKYYHKQKHELDIIKDLLIDS